MYAELIQLVSGLENCLLMKIIFFTQSNWCIPTIQHFKNIHEVVGVVSRTKQPNSNDFLLEFLKGENIPVFNWESSELESLTSKLSELQIDVGISFGFSYKIPASIFDSIKEGVLNVHFGKLPEFAGPDPLFWAIRNEEKVVTISVHKINEEWDSGELIVEFPIPVFPGEPYGLLASRLSVSFPGKLESYFSGQIQFDKKPIEENLKPKSKPTDEILRIDWKKQRADEVEALVNASNPKYGGAITTFRGNPIKILEVSPADVNITGIFAPGSIVYADPNYGIFVLCADMKYLRINILQLEGTIISGQKLAAMGVNSYEKFGE